MKKLWALSLALLIAVVLVMPCQAQSSTDESYVRGLLLTAFTKLREAEDMGVNVTAEAHMLDEALSLIVEAERTVDGSLKSMLLDNATTIIELAIVSINEKVANAPPVNVSLMGLVVGAAASIACCSLGYIYGSRLLWKSWLKLRGRWRVKRVAG
ncbi:MAG: hypothetical protein DRJ62_03265 [Thermoprotei archaeon]|nr:MAG: hypothetical protein DRJ62_03265 [Thermoprotei archaeon]